MTPCSPALQSPSLSGLSPFLGDNDTETLNNVLAANWYFDEETFESVSDEAKDFVSNLIIKEKRCGAGSSHGSPPTCVLSSLPMCHSPC